MRSVAAIAGAALIGLLALSWATDFLARVFHYQTALGAPLIVSGHARLYAPWKALEWIARWHGIYPKPFAVAQLALSFGLAASALFFALARGRGPSIKPFGQSAWAGFSDAAAAGLFAQQGVVLGKLDGEILCFDGPEHQILIGASRSGKGRGHVVPTLLAWPHSALVLDIKGELSDGDSRHDFVGTAGFRAQLGPVLRFAPTKMNSACFNPLFEVRKGDNEVRDVQNIIEILIDPQGDGRGQDFWDRSAKSVLVGIVLHVLYAEPRERKTLAVVREKLRDLDATAQVMKSTLHRLNPKTNQPEVHPEVLHAAESFLAGEERLQSGVKATAEAYKFLTPQAAAHLTELARQDDPFLSLGRVGRTVHVRSIIQRADHAWEVSWTERETNMSGSPDAQAYSGVFTVTTRPPRTSDEVAANPLGLLISEFSWSRVR